uniref:Uncharacterized protein ydr461C-A n=1 Tax=Nakaseomyces delphensis TaxID=51657 RepID=A7WPG9_NAKDE|nr:hypothetical protein [Nakaseomyces delphensis]
MSKKELPELPPSYDETIRNDARTGHTDPNRFRHVHAPIKTAKTNFPAGGTYTYSNNKK